MRVRTMRAALAAMMAMMLAGAAVAQEQGERPPVGGQTGAGEPPAQLVLPGSDAQIDPNQPIKAGFQLSVRTASKAGDEPSLSGTFTVDASGNIQMPAPVGLVGLRGLTPTQAADKLAATLKKYLIEPTVQVTIVAVPKPIVILSGAVARGGAVMVAEGTGLAELITVAGFTENADLSRVRVTHRSDEGRSITEHNLLRWLRPDPGKQPDEASNPVLKDRDFVYVPYKNLPGTGSVMIEGEVTRPGVVPLRLGVPTQLREIFALSGGVTPVADRRSVQIRRIGEEKPLVLDYDKIEEGDASHNIVVQPDDIIYVQKLGVDQYINLNGAFVRPGRVPYTRPVTLVQVVADSGGLLPNAKDWKGRIYRRPAGVSDPTKTQVIAFNFRAIKENKAPDLQLEPGDTVDISVGTAPRAPLDALQITQTALSLFLSFDYLFGSRRRF